MPLPSTENDLKRRARRRLIGAVALTLLAVIVLPLLLEDEPPPASSLAVRMAAKPVAPVRPPAPQPATQAPVPAVPEGDGAPAVSDEPAPPSALKPDPKPVAHPEPKPKPLPKPETVRPEPAKMKPAKPEPAKPEPARPAPAAKPIAPPAPSEKPVVTVSEMFVVQLAALSDAGKADALKARASQAGQPAFTDRVGNLTRVRVGPFPNRAAAVAAAVKLAEHDIAGKVLPQ